MSSFAAVSAGGGLRVRPRLSSPLPYSLPVPFHDRAEAGVVLADLLEVEVGDHDHVVAAGPGGVFVAMAIARRFRIPLHTAVVAEVPSPWNRGPAVGAVAFDGTVQLIDSLIEDLALTRQDIERGVETAFEEVARRCEAIGYHPPFPDLSGRRAVLVDDGMTGLPSLRVAVAALRNAGVRHLIGAFPTGRRLEMHALSREIETLVCADSYCDYRIQPEDAYRVLEPVTPAEAGKVLRWLLQQEPPRAAPRPPATTI